MAGTSLLDIQKGIWDKLKADSILMSMVTDVLDKIPRTQPFPYVRIGEATETKFNTFDRSGRDVTEEIYVYSEYEGFKEALKIMNRVTELLDYKPITLEDNSLVYCRFDDANTSLLTIDQGRTKQVASRFRIIVQEKV